MKKKFIKKNRRFISLMLSLIMIISMVPAVTAQDAASTQAESGSNVDSNVSIIPGKNNFYVVLTDPIQQNKMTYRDGKPLGITDTSDPLYTEDFTMDGITARKTYAANKVYIDMDKTKYDPEKDSRWMVMITYYDFGPQVGYFYFDYTTTSGGAGRYTVEKPGITPKWSTVRFFIDDAKFNSGMDNGADFCLTTRTYNAWAKIELINVAEIERGDSDADVGAIPTVNNIQAESLNSMGLYDVYDENGDTQGLDENMTRGDMLYELLKGWGYQAELDAAAESSAYFTDVSGKYAKAANVALDLGIVSKPADKKFNTQRLATAREMLTFALRHFFPEKENIYENAYNYASQERFIKNTDFVLYPDKPLIRDNFVAVVFNSLFMRTTLESGGENDYVVRLMEKGLFTADDLHATGLPEVAGYKYAIPYYYPYTEIYDGQTGITYNYVNFDGNNANPPYVNKQMFNYAGTKFVFENDKTKSIYEYDTINQTIRYLSSATSMYVSPKDIIYFTDQGSIWAMDWNTYEKRIVSPSPITEYILVSTDEKFASGTSGIQSGGQTGRQNLETGEVEWVHKDFYSVNPNSNGIGHTNVNPGYPHLLFFCHEGTTTLIPDRLWMHNYETNETYNFFVQGENEDGTTAQNSGHEVWSMDGEYMYWVIYTNDQMKGKGGITRMRKDGTDLEHINHDYSYWHCHMSGDGNWSVGDINKTTWGKGAEIGGARIALVNNNTYESWPIAGNIRQYSSSHPYQPHPHMNYGSNVVEWQMVDDNNILGVAWVDMSELTNDDRLNTEIPINDKLTLLTNEKYGTFQTKKTIVEGEEVYDVPQGHNMYVKVNDDYLFEDVVDQLKLEITYYDKGRTPIEVKYTTGRETKVDYWKQEDQKVSIAKSSSGGWKTATVTLKDIAVSNRCSHLTDFVITTNGSRTIIKDVKIVE